jgi:hypothetical protein
MIRKHASAARRGFLSGDTIASQLTWEMSRAGHSGGLTDFRRYVGTDSGIQIVAPGVHW